MSKFKSSWWKTACAVAVLCAASAITSPAQTFTTLVNFNGTNGATSYEPVVQGPDGNLYGMTTAGGANNHGTVFKVTPSGTLTSLHSFCAKANCADGSIPYAALVLGVDGNFYGTTQNGGANANANECPTGCGTIFRITPGGAFTTLYSFCAQTGCADGAAPDAGLVLGTDGNFYGTTAAGGGSSCADGCGTVFKITPQGLLTTLHSFDFSDGYLPVAPLILGTDGNFYGTTADGGNDNPLCFPPGGCGTAFKVSPAGAFTTLHKFDFTDGATPYAPLAQASNGSFSGVTYVGGVVLPNGCPLGCGTIFKISSAGSLTTLHFFDGDGANPFDGMVQGTDGNFYGTTLSSGPDDSGEIFKITPSLTVTTVYSSPYNGGYSALFQATNGIFYGTTTGGPYYGDGCPYGCGSVFSLDVGLGPLVETVPIGGKVGAKVRILGNNLTGTTSVTFNGVPATFAVVSSTLITAMVPAGATTGSVQITTPSGTLTSNVPFRVK